MDPFLRKGESFSFHLLLLSDEFFSMGGHERAELVTIPPLRVENWSTALVEMHRATEPLRLFPCAICLFLQILFFLLTYADGKDYGTGLELT
jgi:hypothetical protein